MTGFARVRRLVPHGEIIFSLKSVNHRGLDLHFHLPTELDPIESDLRSIIKSGVARGHVQIHVSILRTEDAETGQLNRALLHAYVMAYREAARIYQVAEGPDLNSALRLPGMLTGENGAGLPD